MAWRPTQKILRTSSADFGRNVNLQAMMNSSQFKVYINGETYIAITSKSYNILNDIQSETCENGMEYSDHVFSTPTDISFDIYVSKSNLTEFNKLQRLYINREVISVKSLVYDCKEAQITSFTVDDNLFDVYVIRLSITEIYYGDTTELDSMDERFQIVSGTDKYNVSSTIATSEIQSDATASEENLVNTQQILGKKILDNPYLAAILGKNNRVVNVPGEGYFVTFGMSPNSESTSDKFVSIYDARRNNKSMDSVAINANYVDRNTSRFSSVSLNNFRH